MRVYSNLIVRVSPKVNKLLRQKVKELSDLKDRRVTIQEIVNHCLKQSLPKIKKTLK